jgi:hypothetical protein
MKELLKKKPDIDKIIMYDEGASGNANEKNENL